jgi:hypothetical protein
MLLTTSLKDFPVWCAVQEEDVMFDNYLHNGTGILWEKQLPSGNVSSWNVPFLAK